MSQTPVKASFPVVSVLGLIFITLKLLGVIGWSWWLVLLPFYGPLAVGLALIVGLGGGYLLIMGAILVITAICVKLKK